MGNRFTRRRETPANKPETAAEEAVSTQPAEEADVTQAQEAVSPPESVEEKEKLEVVVGESVTLQASLPAEECTSECKEPEAADAAASTPLNDAEPEPVANDTPAPVQPEPLISLSESSAPESVEEPKPTAEVQPEPLIPASESSAPESVEEPESSAPESAEEPKPTAEVQPEPLIPASESSAPESVEEPEPIAEVQPAAEAAPEPEPSSDPEAVTVPEPLSEPALAPVETPEQETDLLTQETLPEPELSAAPLVDLGIPEPTLPPTNNPPSPPPSPVLVHADEPPEVVKCRDSSEAAVISTVVPEEEAPLENPKEAAENLEQLVSDVNEESVTGLLKQLDLTGNDLVSDLIDSDVKIPDESIVDVNTSAEIM